MNRPDVLLVEDDENIRSLYKDALEIAKLSVTVAKDGSEAVTLALENHPKVILMDITLPKMSGHEAMQKIRLDSWGKNAKVIFLTNASDAENVVHAVEVGSAEYIVKANTSVKEVINQVRIAMHS